jgi:hypothetical protein
MTADSIKFTDDEAAAIAVVAGGTWRAPLLTVNENSKTDVARAVLRGRRALVVRDLANGDGTPSGAAAEVLKRLGTGLAAMFMLVDEAGTWVPSGLTAYLYGPSVADIEMSHVIGPAGVHYFKVAPPPGQWQALTLLAGAVHADGFAQPAVERGEAPPVAGFLHVVRPDGIRFIRVAQGTVTTGRGPVPARFPSVADAISWLIA